MSESKPTIITFRGPGALDRAMEMLNEGPTVDDMPGRFPYIKERRLEVLRLRAGGVSRRDIARELDIGEETVKKDLSAAPSRWRVYPQCTRY